MKKDRYDRLTIFGELSLVVVTVSVMALSLGQLL